MRQVAVKMKNEGYTLESFACLVRIREILRRELLDNTEQAQQAETTKQKKMMMALKHNK